MTARIFFLSWLWSCTSVACRVGNPLFGFFERTLVYCEWKSKIAFHFFPMSKSLFLSLKKINRVKSNGSDSLLGIKMGKAVPKTVKTWWKLQIFFKPIESSKSRANHVALFKKWRERFAHGLSFVKSHESHLLIVAF